MVILIYSLQFNCFFFSSQNLNLRFLRQIRDSITKKKKKNQKSKQQQQLTLFTSNLVHVFEKPPFSV